MEKCAVCGATDNLRFRGSEPEAGGYGLRAALPMKRYLGPTVAQP
jgi:hypothetical protein